ncbi:MAG: septal ring lytic transglycosylase RlpA family protein [Pseudomonadota bacterium]
MKTTVSRTLYIALSGASLVALATTGSAHADRKPAPIIYAGSGQSAPTPTVPSRSSIETPRVNDQNRLVFRYPGQATPVAAPSSAPTVPAPSYDQPITFSPPAVASTPAMNATPPGDIVTPQSSQQPIRIAAVQPQAVARTGQPLTLSRVRADRDAKIAEERGRASVYTDGFNGQPTANGEIFDETTMTAAHPSLPLPSLVQVVNEDNGREVVVRVNDRGPFDGKRILELSPRAGSVLGINKGASANVLIRYLGPAPVQRTDQGFAANSVEDEALPPVPAPTPRVETAIYTPPASPAPAPVSIMSVSAPAVSGNVYIQAGAFADISNAQELTSALGRGMNVKIEEARVNGGDFFRVLIGPFQTMDAAEIQREQLSRAGIVDGFLTRR